LLLWERYNGGSIKSAWQRQWSSWLLMMVVAIFFLLHKGYSAEMTSSEKLNSLTGNVATQTMAFAYLMRQWLIPLWLNIDPDLPVLHNFSGLLPQLLLLLVIFICTILSFRRRPLLSFALAWTLLQLIPLYIFLPRLDVANDRQLYLVSWPLALALIVELYLLLSERVFKFSAVLLLIWLAALTVLRNQDYGSELALWQATVKASPDKARGHNNLGYAYMLNGKPDEARAEFLTTLRLNPDYFQARYNLIRLEMQGVEVPPGKN
jgi:tetratricopeptide (TPR) repeat protein